MGRYVVMEYIDGRWAVEDTREGCPPDTQWFDNEEDAREYARFHNTEEEDKA